MFLNLLNQKTFLLLLKYDVLVTTLFLLKIYLFDRESVELNMDILNNKFMYLLAVGRFLK